MISDKPLIYTNHERLLALGPNLPGVGDTYCRSGQHAYWLREGSLYSAPIEPHGIVWARAHRVSFAPEVPKELRMRHQTIIDELQRPRI
jgi:hypothetical protein